LVLAGALFLAKSVLDFLVGPPPPQSVDLVSWVTSGGPFLAASTELLSLGAVALIPAVPVLYRDLSPRHASGAVLGCGVMAAVIPVLCGVCVAQGRLVYPIFGLGAHSPEQVELVVALALGGLHVASLMMAVSTAALAVAMRSGGWSRSVLLLGVASAVADVLGAFPSSVGPVGWLLCGLVSSAWLVALGVARWPRR
jgi:hypothetical protein